jgi:hypothetical protein
MVAKNFFSVFVDENLFSVFVDELKKKPLHSLQARFQLMDDLKPKQKIKFFEKSETIC